jgi:DNA-binding transcriptional LysR family regulator
MAMRHARILRYVDEIARCGSIRKAAERLNVTASAMNRRVADLEDELGARLFERKPRGVRLTSAGELFVRYAREQATDMERVKSQIEDLKGLRRGTVRIACSQALAHEFLPAEIAAFRAAHPLVAFEVKVLDHERAIAALASYDTDLVLVFRPPFLATFQPLMRLPQRLIALMAAAGSCSTRLPRAPGCILRPSSNPTRSSSCAATSRASGRSRSRSASARRRLIPTWWRARSTTATCRRPTSCSATSAGAVFPSPPRYSPSA